MSPRSRLGSVDVSALPPPEPLSSVVVVPELLELDEDPLDDPADTLVIPVVVTADESETGAGRRRGPGARRGGETSPWRL